MSQAKRQRKQREEELKAKRKKNLVKALAVLASLIVIAAIIVGITALANRPPKQIEKDKLPVATIEFENFGTVEIELYPYYAPNTVNNFIDLANSGYYDGIKVARICEGFCIQMGTKDGGIVGDTDWSIRDEFIDNGYKWNELKHEKGVISMARSNSRNSASTQFFICTDSNSSVASLDSAYAGFGKVINGMDVIDRLNVAPNDNSYPAGGGKPLTDIIVKSIKVDTKGTKYRKPERISR